jgi:hypothetical protein
MGRQPPRRDGALAGSPLSACSADAAAASGASKATHSPSSGRKSFASFGTGSIAMLPARASALDTDWKYWERLAHIGIGTGLQVAFGVGFAWACSPAGRGFMPMPRGVRGYRRSCTESRPLRSALCVSEKCGSVRDTRDSPNPPRRPQTANDAVPPHFSSHES